MPAIPDYAKLKPKVKKFEAFNKKARQNGIKWCRHGRTKAEALVEMFEKDTATLNGNIAKLDKASKQICAGHRVAGRTSAGPQKGEKAEEKV